MTKKQTLHLLAALAATVGACSSTSTSTGSGAATNAGGTGAASAPASAATTPSVPGAPTNVVAFPADRAVTVTWSAPAVTGGSPITRYEVVGSPSTPPVSVTGTSATILNLSNGTAYTFQVRATNAVGQGPQSAPSAAVTPAVVTQSVTALAIYPSNPQLPLDRTLQVAAIATLADGSSLPITASATWLSSAPVVVTVAGGRLAAAAGAGAGASATITAAYGGVTSAPVTVTLLAPASAVGPGYDNDPLADDQWHLHNTGQTAFAQNAGVAGNDIDAVVSYRAGFTGRGVKIAVVDSGLEVAHEDLAGNVAPGSWNFLSGTSNPTSTATDGDHGTSVAGLVAAVRNNGKGGMGVAPAASLNGYNYLASGATQTIANWVASMGGGSGSGGPRSTDVSVFNQSFGVATTAPFPPGTTREAQYLDGVTNLRGGLGAIYVKSAGNGFLDYADSSVTPDCAASNRATVSCENAAMDPYNTLPMNVVVSAFTARGRRASYSTAGAAIWVSAPGGEYGFSGAIYCPTATDSHGACPPYYFDPAMVTTDQSSCSVGFATSSTVGSLFDTGKYGNSGCNYMNGFNGSSSAAPVVSGVVALLLEANPALGWRDVKAILASTARPIDPGVAPVTLALSDGPYTVEPGWTTNAAGHRFHNWYGFGALDADAAVAAARAWAPGSLPAWRNTGWVNGSVSGAGAIPDNSVAGALGGASVSPALTIEAVQVRVSTDHAWLGDLGVELTSPSGTRSVLLNAVNGYGANSGTITIQLASNAFFGETSAGTWTLKVVDATATNTGRLVSWQLRIYGH